MKGKISVIFIILFVIAIAVYQTWLRKQSPEDKVVFKSDSVVEGAVSESDELASGKFNASNKQRFKVAYAVDGDTVKLTTGEALRYIGIDTPETKHPRKPVEFYGKEASAFNKQLVQGKDILVEFDVTERDRYGRLLGYVYLPDGTFVNAELVKQGYAKAYTYPPNVKYIKLFRSLQAGARKNKRGLWNRGEE